MTIQYWISNNGNLNADQWSVPLNIYMIFHWERKASELIWFAKIAKVI